MTIDERFEYLQRNIDALHANIERLYDTVSEHSRQIEKHEREQARFRRAMRAALAAWLDEGENGDGTQG
jgi:prefoldin subunit 5